MSQFEYIMVMVALILALALAQSLRGLSEIVTSQKRYWPHALWLVSLAFIMVQGWWADWDYNAVGEWRFTTYLLVLASPAISFAAAHLLVPATRAIDIDWQAQFSAVRQWFFGLLITYFLVAVVQSVFLYGTPLLHPYRLFQILLILILLVGFFVHNDRVQKALPPLFIAINIIGQLVVRMNIGALMID